MSSLNVLITGATSGIGLSLVEQYLTRGENVIACGRNQEKMASLESSVTQSCLFDMTDELAVQNAAKEVQSIDGSKRRSICEIKWSTRLSRTSSQEYVCRIP